MNDVEGLGVTEHGDKVTVYGDTINKLRRKLKVGANLPTTFCLDFDDLTEGKSY